MLWRHPVPRCFRQKGGIDTAATIIICVLLAGILVLAARHSRKVLRSGCCGSDGDPAPKKIRARDRDPGHYPYEKILGIDGMSCQNCVMRVQNALNALDGVYSKVDLGRKTAVVRMKEELPDEVLRKAVADAGYSVGGVTPGA